MRRKSKTKLDLKPKIIKPKPKMKPGPKPKKVIKPKPKNIVKTIVTFRNGESNEYLNDSFANALSWLVWESQLEQDPNVRYIEIYENNILKYKFF